MTDRRRAELARRRNARRGSRRSRRLVVVATVLASFTAIFVAVVVAGVVAASSYFDNLSRKAMALTVKPVSENTLIYARDGTLLTTVASSENRIIVPLARVSPWLRQATVAIEDRRFYEHNGVDWVSIARAAAADLKAGKITQGGSTLTQQLVRGLYLNNDVSFDRKIKEAYLAIEYEKVNTKDQILEQYLNTVPYGHFAYGAEAASLTYFSRHASQLTMVQAALLAGLPQAPSRFDPFANPARATLRRNDVLHALLDQGSISLAAYHTALAAPLGLKRGQAFTQTARAPYFTQYVRNALEGDPQFGSSAVLGGGLRVKTTIDGHLQKAAYAAMRSIMKKPPCARAPQPSCDPAAALVSIDPRTGEIRAMASTSSFGSASSQTEFNYALGRRQPGSTFKPFTLASALEGGMNPATTRYISGPFTIGPNDRFGKIWGKWHVETAERSAAGPITVEAATVASDNTVFAQLALDVGPDVVRDMAVRLGIDPFELPHVASLTLGSASVTPLEMTGAYATFAANGVYHEPHAIREVDFAGSNQKISFRTPAKRVLSDGVASEVTRILGENIVYGTGARARTTDRRPQAGKTGTTDGAVDAWFCGYTPDLATCVWVGYPVSEEYPLHNVEGVGTVYGGTLPAMIWHGFMNVALLGVPPHPFPVARHPVVFKPWLTQFSLAAAAALAASTESTGSTGKTGTGKSTGTGTPTGTSTGPGTVIQIP